MKSKKPIRIEVEAARALVNWKYTFAEEVTKNAIKLAQASANPSLLTTAHYREAAVLALSSLAKAIQNGDRSNVQRQAS